MMTQIITKETVHNIQFWTDDVLQTESEKQQRFYKLERAMKLGNVYKQQVCIHFKGVNGEVLKTIATIWALTETYIVLKSHIMIPIKSILEIDYVASFGAEEAN